MAIIPEEDRNDVYEGHIFWHRALLLTRLGESETARSLAEHYRDAYLEKIEEADDYARHHAFLSLAYAFLGERESALAEGRRAVKLADERGAYSSPRQRQNLAIIHLILDNQKEALDLLCELLATSFQYPLTRQELFLDPLWDPLRDDPDFARLIEDPGVTLRSPQAGKFSAFSAR